MCNFEVLDLIADFASFPLAARRLNARLVCVHINYDFLDVHKSLQKQCQSCLSAGIYSSVCSRFALISAAVNSTTTISISWM